MDRTPVHDGFHSANMFVTNLIATDTVRWGGKATGVRAMGGGRHEGSFADGTTVTTDLLVGEDWADSIDVTSPEAGKKAVLAHFDDWDDSLRALVADAGAATEPTAMPARAPEP
jgi:hypothetical protein